MWSRLRLLWNLKFSSDRAYYKIANSLFGLCPSNIELYKLALIHRSASLLLEDGSQINNERLEFLGDAVIETIVSDYLFIEFPEEDEGFLTQMRSKIVSRATLNTLALGLGLDQHIIVQRSGSLTLKHLYGDALEAMFGAIYLDQGFEVANRLLINKILKKHLDVDQLLQRESDVKSRLLEWCQQEKLKLHFETSFSEQSTQRNPHFKSEVWLEEQLVGRGVGDSKKRAEQMAARSSIEGIKEHFPEATWRPFEVE